MGYPRLQIGAEIFPSRELAGNPEKRQQSQQSSGRQLVNPCAIAQVVHARFSQTIIHRNKQSTNKA
jgi:hypothetical protein